MTPLPAPGSPDAPKYWKDETSGMLAAAIRAYRDNPDAMTSRDIWLMRAYLKQWVDSPVWDANPHASEESRRMLGALRTTAGKLSSGLAIERWIAVARKEGIDPL